MIYSKKQIRKAGIILKENEHDNEALDILSVMYVYKTHNIYINEVCNTFKYWKSCIFVGK